jgi:hypothetical protein
VCPDRNHLWTEDPGNSIAYDPNLGRSNDHFALDYDMWEKCAE